MQKFLLIFLGSGLGGTLRYWLSGCAQRFGNGLFPLGTMVVNISGCLVIGFLSAAFADRALAREEYRLALTVGLVGGFTTFSTFGIETFSLLSEGRHGHAMTNVCLSVVLGISAIGFGYWLGKSCFGT